MKSLAVHEQEKRLDIDEFFNKVKVPNNQLIKIKKNSIRLLNELLENKIIHIIHNEVRLVLKSGKKKDQLIKSLTTSDITRRLKYIQFHEKIENF